MVLFDSPHENLSPLMPQPDEIGVHFLNQFSHPGDSHSFSETKTILALPITAPWGSTVRAVNVAIALKPQYVIPIHDWHWHEEARSKMYSLIETVLSRHDITFLKVQNDLPIEVNL